METVIEKISNFKVKPDRFSVIKVMQGRVHTGFELPVSTSIYTQKDTYIDILISHVYQIMLYLITKSL